MESNEHIGKVDFLDIQIRYLDYLCFGIQFGLFSLIYNLDSRFFEKGDENIFWLADYRND